MSFLDFLFGGKRRKNLVVTPDQIWLTSDAKFTGLENEAEERSKADTVALLLVAHFPDVLERLEALAANRAWQVPCKVVLASNLNAELAEGLQLDPSEIIDVIVAERHPLPSVDDRLKEFAVHLPCRCRFSHHVSLEDPVMRVFAGQWVSNVLKQLGMKDNESIESSMVSRRIRKAQEKIEGRSFGGLRADSSAAWLEKNCPELTKG